MNKFEEELKKKIQDIRLNETSIASCTDSMKETWYGSTCVRNDFLTNQMPSYLQVPMVLLELSRKSMIMPTK